MAWTTPATAVAGSTALTASFWNTNVRDNSLALPRGYITQTTLATTFSTSSAAYVDVTGLSVTFTAEANRRYEIILNYAIGAGAGVSQVVINDTSNDIAEGYASIASQVNTSTIFATVTPAAGSRTYKARVLSNSGSISVYGISTRTSLACRLLVVDLGSTV